MLPLCSEIGTTFVAYCPLGRGFLTGKIQSPAAFEEGDIRRTSPRFHAENLQRNRLLLERLEQFASHRRMTLAQLALAFILNQPQPIVPIPGTKRSAYLSENVAAVDIPLSRDELAQLAQLMPVGAAAGQAYDPKYGGAPPVAGPAADQAAPAAQKD